ncbi:MAG: hypothetical protein H6Q73_1802 [Firmicutes bacterium]|nr:hypothetical protein [Bacillota bacterium]
MTKKELSQLYYLNREIGELQIRLGELECLATSCTAHITGMPRAYDISDKLSKYVAEIADLKSLLDLNLKKCFYELNRLNRYIQSVDDSEMRMILSLRYINGLSWNQVAASISICATEDSVRKAHDRFLKKSCPICPGEK